MAKILIVDDSAALRTQFMEALVKGGHEVLGACDGEDGLRVAGANKDLQLIISDYNMPVMDGLVMISKIRELGGFEKTPVFMLSTESGPAVVAKGKSLGVVAWIVKPFQAEKVLAAIAKVVR